MNPQSLNDKTLAEIGRKHTAEDFFKAYEIADKYGFDINCDLIAGFSNETEEDFARTVDGVSALKPANITVHTLALKNGSKNYNEFKQGSIYTEQMTDYARNALTRKGYIPYYLYRQKRMAGNLENTGYSLPGKVSVNNVSVMEETISVVACGAGAISKIVHGGDIGRFANLRDVNLYLERKDEITKKLNYIENRFTK